MLIPIGKRERARNNITTHCISGQAINETYLLNFIVKQIHRIRPRVFVRSPREDLQIGPFKSKVIFVLKIERQRLRLQHARHVTNIGKNRIRRKLGHENGSD